MRRALFIGLIAVALTGACGSDDGDGEQVAARSTTTTSGSDTTVALEEPTTTAPPTTAATATTRAPGRTTTTARAANAPTTTRGSGTTASPSPTTTAQPATTTTAGGGGAGGGAAITIQNFTFNPPLLDVKAGTAVTATNKDSAPHTWTADDRSWDSKSMNQNQSFTRTFPTAGTFPYSCTIHPSMKGTVRVT